ncbi:hypothetical protein BZARG_757 [Bizionia argentinensis JUB59]|uniref:Uncharacterized protein n=1 Tax=Bizionia argentinensis JUB59 TaxID=1046627 RepID=G2EB74_9FLAO|nr:hypothetical protein [Bizionia argentinensis]EGV44353.2 hypothetical protein BZARG_757 [Bizionia argentinensis JUB59]
MIHPQIKKSFLWSHFDFTNPQHRYVLSLAMQFGWSKIHPITGKQVADLGALDKWLKGKSKIGQSPVLKPLMEMTPTETSRIIVALENMVAKKHEA